MAVNVCVPETFSDALEGATETEVKVKFELTVTAAEPDLVTPPTVAEADTVALPALAPAEYKPEELIDPTPLTLQVMVGCGLKALPF